MYLYIANSFDNSVIESVVDGDGVRLVIFFNGCPHHCLGCHNPLSWDLEKGQRVEVSELADYIVKRYSEGIYSGITLSGGDPIFQDKPMLELIKILREKIPSLNIWCYTGYKYEHICKIELLKHLDVLVDGPFIIDRKLPKKKFRGSNNQRILYLKNGEIVKEL